MAYGLQDVVNQRRMIDESPADEGFKRVMRDKLDALLALAESAECRRVRILGYFGEDSKPCGNCDNCLHPPEQFNATEAARKLLSCIYRVRQSSGLSFGAGHIMDILRGKRSDKVLQHQHERLSTFGIGADLAEAQWRALMRQLIAREAIRVDAEHFNTLQLDHAAKPILKGEQTVWLKAATRASRVRKPTRSASTEPLSDPQAQAIFEALKTWRGQVAREHGLPAYVIFHDASLRAIAEQAPQSAADLQDINGMGEKKRDAYGEAVLRVVRDALT
jgi:ATP-dependent DNA helicase RecQ